MAGADDKDVDGGVLNDIEGGYDGKGHGIEHIDGDKNERNYVPTYSSEIPPVLTTSRKFEPPEFVRNLSREERNVLEAKLKRKIDLRLLPMIVLMYIMNYLDRVGDLTMWWVCCT